MTSYHSISKVDAEDAEEPVTLAEAKSWLRVASNDDDANIGMMIKGARETLEQYLNRAIVKSDVTVKATTDIKGGLRLPFVESISEVTVTDEEDAEVEADDYTLRGDRLLIGCDSYYAVAYTIDPVIPEALKEAVLMEVAQRYTNRGENVGGSGMSEAAKQKADPYKIIWL